MKEETMEGKTMTADELCKRWNISLEELKKILVSGKLPAYRKGEDGKIRRVLFVGPNNKLIQ